MLPLLPQSLGLQQVARANLASYPHIVDWVGITRAVLRRAVKEVRHYCGLTLLLCLCSMFPPEWARPGTRLQQWRK